MLKLDRNLIQIYKKMIGLTQIDIDLSGNTIFIDSSTLNSNLYVSGYTIFNNNITVASDIKILGNIVINLDTLNISNNLGNIILNNNLTINSNLNISGNSNIGYLVVSGNTNILGNTTINNILNVSGITTIQGTLLTTIIQPVNNNILTINGNTINIGNNNSSIIIQGTSTYVGTTLLQTTDKIITLNINSLTYTGADIGNYSGIQIIGTGGTGFIQTNIDASKYLIKAPMSLLTNYILTQDANNNLNISGISTLNNNVSINSYLNVSNMSIIQGLITVNSFINISGTSIIGGQLSINSSLNISGNTIISGNVTLLNTLIVSGPTIINNNIYLSNNAFISGNSIINGNATITNILNVSGISLINLTTIGTKLNVSLNSILQNNVSFLSLNVSGPTIIQNNMSIGSQLQILGSTIMNSNTNINSNLNVSGITNIYGNTTCSGNINVFGQLTTYLPNYSLNSIAAANIPIGRLYRNGGIVCVCVNTVSPTIYLSGNTTLTVYFGNSYNEPGAYALDYNNINCPVYLNSIYSGNTNILLNSILLSGKSTLINLSSSLTLGYYTATYQATDSDGLIGYNNRLLYAYTTKPLTIAFNTTNIIYNFDSVTTSPGPIFTSDMQVYAYTQFILSNTALTSINFNYNQNWIFVFKVVQSISTEPNLEIGWDWNPPANTYRYPQGSANWLNNTAPRWSQILGSRNHDGGGFTYPVFNSAAVISAQTTGYYLEVSYINGSVSFTMKDLSLNIIKVGTSTYTYQNKVQPFYIYSGQPTFILATTFYTNILFSQSSTPPIYAF